MPTHGHTHTSRIELVWWDLLAQVPLDQQQRLVRQLWMSTICFSSVFDTSHSHGYGQIMRLTMMLMTILWHYMAPIFIAVGSDCLYYLSVSDYHAGESHPKPKPQLKPNPNRNSSRRPSPLLASSAHARRLSTPAPCCRSFGEICQSISSVKVPIKGFLVSITKSHVSTPLSSFRKCVLVCTYECQSVWAYVCGAFWHYVVALTCWSTFGWGWLCGSVWGIFCEIVLCHCFYFCSLLLAPLLSLSIWQRHFVSDLLFRWRQIGFVIKVVRLLKP